MTLHGSHAMIQFVHFGEQSGFPRRRIAHDLVQGQACKIGDVARAIARIVGAQFRIFLLGKTEADHSVLADWIRHLDGFAAVGRALINPRQFRFSRTGAVEDGANPVTVDFNGNRPLE